ncbi:valine--tRNA ligase [Nesterenkonia sphaerica]|uniref:Valine--tRNA ligase n=1 Tax=Nesterenkonia sphaerica TaxID=1804988 RepID=A0A5R9AH60_9MICC|nr:valine--tRNA ligase [Nesterenkonia sphaerica]TLP77504.1 valine--tRNA ligase [Nesterenkonia sphaerica]
MAENIKGTDTPAYKTPEVPEKPALEGLETKLSAAWSQEEIFHFDDRAPRDEVYSIDTPPPTASGSLHVGHMFSYTHTDVVARYKRMRGKKVFYPLGWDDNGLPTERRVQNYYGVRCDPSQPYDPNYTPPEKPAKNQRDWDMISRRNFIELCETLTVEDEKVFEDLFTTLGLSVDWRQTYRTIDDDSRTASQRAFIRDVHSGNAYTAEAPTLWDVTFRTAVAQAELEAKERPSAYYRYPFTDDAGNEVTIATTRPELLPSCVALVAHPDDERYQGLFGSTVTSPLFDVEVPVRAHPLADPEKGSGIAMICTFGDMTDVTWWRELNLPTRAVIGRDGRLSAETPEWITTTRGRENYQQLAGKTVHSAKEAAIELLQSGGLLRAEPEKITHAVHFYEKGDKPLEVVTSRQWYIRNGGRDAQRREQLIERGRKITWNPGFMRSRYENWVEGLNGDWLISRQRFFGVPIPVWYPLSSAGEPDYDHPILPEEHQLPVDPAAEPAPGYTESQRGEPGGFMGEPDVFDTWATSSLTPQIAGKWERDPDLFERVFPFDLRPQGHDIIRTWLFSSVVRANTLHQTVPWTNTAISGWILDPDRKKMSKSKGNVVVPNEPLEQFGADAVRYWAASARLGADTAYEISQMKIGRRLAIKLLNASKFAFGMGVTEEHIVGPGTDSSVITEPLDQALLAKLRTVVQQATEHFDDYDYARALSLTESFFWSFTDDYVELVKDRAYGAQGEQAQASVRATLATALDKLLRLFAPVLPFATDEVWRWWRRGSVHAVSWPQPAELDAVAGSPAVLDAVAAGLTSLRRAKAEANVKQRTEILSARITGSQQEMESVRSALRDLQAATKSQVLQLESADDAAPEIVVSELQLAEAGTA